MADGCRHGIIEIITAGMTLGITTPGIMEAITAIGVDGTDLIIMPQVAVVRIGVAQVSPTTSIQPRRLQPIVVIRTRHESTRLHAPTTIVLAAIAPIRPITRLATPAAALLAEAIVEVTSEAVADALLVADTAMAEDANDK